MLRFPPSAAIRTRWCALAVAALAGAGLCAGLTACSDGSSTADELRATVAPSSADPMDDDDSSEAEDQEADGPDASGDLTVEEEVEAAYLEASRIFFSFMEDPHQDLIKLEDVRMAESLDHIREVVERARERGEASTYPSGYPEAELLELKVDGHKAVVTACETNDAIVRDSDGALVNDDVVTRTYESHLEYVEGRWLVAVEYVVDKHEGRFRCDV